MGNAESAESKASPIEDHILKTASYCTGVPRKQWRIITGRMNVHPSKYDAVNEEFRRVAVGPLIERDMSTSNLRFDGEDADIMALGTQETLTENSKPGSGTWPRHIYAAMVRYEWNESKHVWEIVVVHVTNLRRDSGSVVQDKEALLEELLEHWEYKVTAGLLKDRSVDKKQKGSSHLLKLFGSSKS